MYKIVFSEHGFLERAPSDNCHAISAILVYLIGTKYRYLVRSHSTWILVTYKYNKYKLKH